MDYFDNVFFNTFLCLEQFYLLGSQWGQSQASQFLSKIKMNKLLWSWNDMRVSIDNIFILGWSNPLKGTENELRIRKKKGEGGQGEQCVDFCNQAENGGTDLCTLFFSHTIALKEERPCFIRSEVTFYFLISAPFVLRRHFLRSQYKLHYFSFKPMN